MKSTVTWKEARTFEGETDTGFRVTIGNAHGDTPKPGPSPMELVLMGAGACSVYDVVSILEKARQDIDDVSVELDAERAAEPPKVFTRIHMHFIVKGRGIAEPHVKRAIDLSVGKYCSATQMLQKTAEVATSYEIVEAG